VCCRHFKQLAAYAFVHYFAADAFVRLHSHFKQLQDDMSDFTASEEEEEDHYLNRVKVCEHDLLCWGAVRWGLWEKKAS
jgi:hypothetical protein